MNTAGCLYGYILQSDKSNTEAVLKLMRLLRYVLSGDWPLLNTPDVNKQNH